MNNGSPQQQSAIAVCHAVQCCSCPSEFAQSVRTSRASITVLASAAARSCAATVRTAPFVTTASPYVTVAATFSASLARFRFLPISPAADLRVRASCAVI